MLKTHLRAARTKARESWHRRNRFSAPALTQALIVDGLRALAVRPPTTLMVHSSLSSCGFVEGGAAAVIGALTEWIDGGTLCMPAHSYCYPTDLAPAAVFDPVATPSVVGAIADRFWRQPLVSRSLHPSHSLAARGPAAASLLTGHQLCDTPCGSGTPYARLLDSDAAVLMFGATLQSYTLFHTAEDAAQAPYLYEAQPVTLRYRDITGEHEMRMRRQDMSVTRAFAEKAEWLAERRLLFRTALGAGILLFIPHGRALHDAIVEALRRDPRFLLAA